MESTQASLSVVLAILGLIVSIAVTMAVLRLFQISDDVRAIRVLLERRADPSVAPRSSASVTNAEAKSWLHAAQPATIAKVDLGTAAPDGACPNCRTPRSDTAVDCGKCGIVFANWKGRSESPRR